MTNVLPSIDGWSTIRRFEEANFTARASRRSSLSSSDASEYSAFSSASDTSSATSLSTTSTVSWNGATRASHLVAPKQTFHSSQQSDFTDEGYGSSGSQSSDGRLSEAFLESLDLGHPTGTSYFRRPGHPVLPTCDSLNKEQPCSLPAISQAQQVSCSSLAQSIPRRTSASRSWSRPSLVRQTDRRLDFVEHLVDSATQLVALIWPHSATPSSTKNRKTGNSVIPLRIFIRETLRRSRTSYSTLQVTLYYLVLIKKKGGLPQYDPSYEGSENPSYKALQCGRRMFLAGLILASKYLQDRNFSARAWSKISGLQVKEININEMAFLDAISWKLHIKMNEFNEWSNQVSECTEAAQRGLACPWTKIVEHTFPTAEATSPVVETAPASVNKMNLPTDFDRVDSWTKANDGSPLSAPPTRRPSWAPRQLSSENLSLNSSRSSTPSTLEPQCQVAPPAPSNLGRNLCTPQFTPWIASNSSLSTPAESAQTLLSSYGPAPSVCGSERGRCMSWLARRGSVSSRTSQSSASSGYSGASNRWTYPPPTMMATTAQTTGMRSLYIERTPSLVTSPRSMGSSEDQSSIGSITESSELMRGYPSPPMSDDGPISPTRSETSRMFLRSAEEATAMPKPTFFPPRLPALANSRCPGLLSAMVQQSSSSSSASNTPTPTSFSATNSRGTKRRSEETYTTSDNGVKFAKFAL